MSYESKLDSVSTREKCFVIFIFLVIIFNYDRGPSNPPAELGFVYFSLQS